MMRSRKIWLQKSRDRQSPHPPQQRSQENFYSSQVAQFMQRTGAGKKCIRLSWNASSRSWKRLLPRPWYFITSNIRWNEFGMHFQRPLCLLIPTFKRGEMVKLESCLHTRSREELVLTSNAMRVKQRRLFGTTSPGLVKIISKPTPVFIAKGKRNQSLFITSVSRNQWMNKS